MGGRRRQQRGEPAERPGRTDPIPGTPDGDRRRPVIRFVLWLAGLTIAFNAFFYLSLSKSSAFESYLDLNADISATVLRAFGEEAQADGTTIRTPRFALAIKKGCDAVQASAFYVFIVLASPVAASIFRRLPMVLLGVAALLVLNLVRVITLYYAGVHLDRKWFDVMHVDVWQAMFIFMPLFFWFLWVRSARRTAETSDATR